MALNSAHFIGLMAYTLLIGGYSASYGTPEKPQK